MTDLNDIMGIYQGAVDEAEDRIFDKIRENGRVTLKAGSPALASLYALDEVIMHLLTRLFQQRTAVAHIFELPLGDE